MRRRRKREQRHTRQDQSHGITLPLSVLQYTCRSGQQNYLLEINLVILLYEIGNSISNDEFLSEDDDYSRCCMRDRKVLRFLPKVKSLYFPS